MTAPGSHSTDVHTGPRGSTRCAGRATWGCRSRDSPSRAPSALYTYDSALYTQRLRRSTGRPVLDTLIQCWESPGHTGSLLGECAATALS